MIKLNKALLVSQGVTPEQEVKIQKVHVKIANLLKESRKAPLYKQVDLANRMLKLEFKLQKHWNFPQDATMHQHTWSLHGCTCHLVLVLCPYHHTKDHLISKSVRLDQIGQCCFDCASKHRVRPQYDGTYNRHEGVCELCEQTKQVSSAKKLFGLHKFL